MKLLCELTNAAAWGRAGRPAAQVVWRHKEALAALKTEGCTGWATVRTAFTWNSWTYSGGNTVGLHSVTADTER